MKSKTLLIVALSALSVSSLAFAAESKTQEQFNKLDTNHDGYISQDEAKAQPDLSENYSQADTNKNGQIDESEFSAFETSEMKSTPEQPSESPEQTPSESQ